MTSPEQTRIEPVPSPEAVRLQLDAILKSRALAKSPRLSRFLAYVVGQRLVGSEDRLKEYSIGVDVFDREEASFDPRADTIVRVQARRLRTRLEEYYAGEGRGDSVHIELPKGGYVPEFRIVSPWMSSGAKSSTSHVLPIPRTSLVGRDSELAELRGLMLREEVRLVTLTGVGGSGKTRLAIDIASELSGAFSGRIMFASLANVGEVEAGVALIAKAAGLRRTRGLSLRAALVSHLGSSVRCPTLLVLDSLEHIPEVGNLVADILDECKSLRFLVTSRSPLGLYGEREFVVHPLETPPLVDSSQDEDLSKNPAVMLLVERTQAVNREFKLTKSNVSCLAEICRRLDGLPLAIELAAARCKTLTPSALLAKLSSPLSALQSGPADLPPRHQKLRAAIDWSWALLSESEQKLFRRLAAFTAGFTYESAEAVADTACDLGISASDVVDSLVDKSLLSVMEPLDEEPFFSMLQTIREYGLEKLQESGESPVIRRALAAYCLVLTEEGWTANGNEESSAWMARCEAEYLNISVSLRWLIDQQQTEWAARMCLALFPYWERYDLLSEGRRLMEGLLDLPNLTQRHRAMASSNLAALVCLQSGLDAGVRAHEDAITLARDLGDLQCISREANAMGGACHRKGDLRSALEFFEEALEACHELADGAQEAAILSNMAAVASETGDYARADELLRKTVEIFLALGHHSGLAWSFHRLGDHERRQGNRDAAERRYEEALKLFGALKDHWGIGRSLQALADLCCQAGNYRDAEAMFGEALALFHGMSRKRGVGLLLDNLADAQASLGRSACALTLAGAAAGLRESLGLEERPWSPEDLQRRDKILAQAGVEFDRIALDPAWNRGVKMTLPEAVDFARRLEWSLLTRS